MNAVAEAQPQFSAPSALAPLLRTVVVCDLADSAQLTQRLGDAGSAGLAQRLDRLARDLVYRHRGREIDKSDGFLLLFERPVQAVAFALDYQRGLRELAQAESLPLSARIGIHVGDVLLWENTPDDIARGAKPVEVEGLAKSVAARLMSLALPGQILLSAIACTLAQRSQSELVAQRAPPQWKMHGRYLFKGVAEAMRVYEVGEKNIAPLKRPAWTGKAHREVPWWRRPGMLAVEAAALVAAIAVPAYLWLRSPPAIAFADRDWVVIGDLHNLTGEIVLDGSLETAFRLGLEQSRYVNVMSDLKVRDTLALMQRDPAHTHVDRAVGSEVAIRDGARALILPTVAEVGGHVRVTAEVIDPHTQATVYTESADGHGLNSVLPTIDAIDRKLRLRLGEALVAVSETNKPLEQVATANLDALRAYSLGQRAYFTGNMKDALAFYRDAVRLDPQFATAHLVIGRIWINANQNSDTLKQIELAAATPNRLSARDSLLVDAWRSTLTSPGTALHKWKSLTALYPDFYPANGPYSYYAWCDNHYLDAITAAKLNVAPQNPNASAGEYLLGILYLAQERYADAAAQFQRAFDAGVTRTNYAALLDAAQRRFDRALQTLGKNKASGIPSDDLSTEVIRIALTVDQGRWHDAKTQLTNVASETEKHGAFDQQYLHGIALGLESEFGQYDFGKLNTYVQDIEKLKTDNGIDANQALFRRLFTIYLMAHNGDARRATQLLSSLGPSTEASGETPLNNLRTIVEAELARVDGHPQQAIESLKPIVNGNELFLTHRALMDAYASAGLREQALTEARWLAQHRGRAYAEYGANQFMMAYNVVQSDLALLRVAELLHDLGRQAESAEALSEFAQAWPSITTPAIAARKQALQHKQ
ncbi:MAG: putative peptide modification system cyclase [Xanthomonadaceae bacterium]|nr:putative peptide modification system cyclase [Xanthomonadaceae bacterium]MDE2083926.1 putative peptide modification system cyclase [Xanthomonadaceae bacterium]